MAPSEKPKAKNLKPTEEEIAAIASDVANFASSIGLAPAHLSSSSGFDDSDFRKSGPVQPSVDFDDDEEEDDDEPVAKPVPTDAKPKPKPKPHPLTLAPPIINKFDNLPKLPLVKASALSGAWYVDADEIEIRVLGEDGRNKKVESVTGVEELKELVRTKKELGERLMMQYVKDYEMGRKKNGDVRLLETTTRSGTSADKVSAFACLVEDNPIANFRALDALLSMVTSKVGKRYAFTGFEALKDIFLLRLLPDRKLKYLIQRPLDKLPETKDGYSLLLFWHWEECLKQRYERFVIALEESLKDMLPSLKDRAMKAVYTLLKSKSEQERRLLSALVNKLGDPERKAASNAAYQLSCLLSAHPNMKAVVIEEVDSFVFRPHIGLQAKYYAVNFLSQIFLTRNGDGPKTAKRMLDLYFALFKVLISDTVSCDGKKKYNKKDKERGKSNKKHGKNDSEEPHVEMDSRLLSILLTGVNRAFPYVSSDEADDIVETQTPILYRLVHSENFNVGVQALMLLCQISSKNQIASDRFYRALYAVLLTPAAVNSSKPEMFLGLLVKAMRSDINSKRVAAFAKRLLQVALQRPPQYACGCLFMISEVLKAKPLLWTMVLQKEMVDDEIEHFTDIVDDPDNVDDPPLNKAISQDENKLAISEQGNEKNNGFTQKNIKNEKDQESHEGPSLPAGYSPRHREPSYCNADRAGWWELAVLASHVHPSVATMAQTLLSGAHIVYNGDPLNDLSLASFLDKLMEKKPKPNKKAEGRWHGGSQIAPVGKLDMSHSLIGGEILSLAEEDVPPEDIVFHRFYANKTTSKKKLKKKKKAQGDDGNEILASDDEGEAIDNMSDGDEDEIDDVLGSAVIDDDPSSENYDYDDLDKVIDEEEEDDDDDLINFDDDDMIVNKEDDDVEKEDIGDVMDSEDDGAASSKKRKKKEKKRENEKTEKKSRVSPFVSMEEYEHLMTADDKVSSKFSKRKKMKKQ